MAKRTSNKSKSTKSRTTTRTISGAVNRATAGRRSKASARASTKTAGGRTRTSASGMTRTRRVAARTRAAAGEARRPAGQMSEQTKRRIAELGPIARQPNNPPRRTGQKQPERGRTRTQKPEREQFRQERPANLERANKQQLYQRTTDYRAQKRREEDVFASTIQKANLWLKQVMNELGTDDRHRAYAALKAVLHTLRDRLTVEEAVDLSAQLPILIRGIYFEGWTPSGKPIKYSKQEFVGTVDGYFVNVSGINAGDIIRAVFKVLQDSIPEGEIRHIIDTMPEEFGEFWTQEELTLQS
jgi:uncharacterized protein (DUF2267 family)